MSSTHTLQPVCQSCGLPLESRELFGTDASGARVADYCVYCYHQGAFTEPAISRDEMIERVADHLMKMEHFRHFQARELAEGRVPKLKRWQPAPSAQARDHSAVLR